MTEAERFFYDHAGYSYDPNDRNAGGRDASAAPACWPTPRARLLADPVLRVP